MRPNRRVLSAAAALAATIAVVGTTTAGASAAPAAAPAAAHSAVAAKAGTNSLASVLLASGGAKWDKSWNDYNILTHAVLAVLQAKPNSPVKVLTEGNVRLTAFLPNDNAFRALVASLTGKLPKTEQATFAAVAALGIPTIEKVLLYHVIPNTAILSPRVVKANGAVLKTALGSTITVHVYSLKPLNISLWDNDHNSPNPRLIASQLDINKGNLQVAHGINRVLRPIDLPPLAH